MVSVLKSLFSGDTAIKSCDGVETFKMCLWWLRISSLIRWSLCAWARRRSQKLGPVIPMFFWAGFGAVMICRALLCRTSQVRDGECLCWNNQPRLSTVSLQGIFKRICSSLLSLSPLFQSVHEWFGGRQAAGEKSFLHDHPKTYVHKDTCK